METVNSIDNFLHYYDNNDYLLKKDMDMEDMEGKWMCVNLTGF